MGEHDDYPRLHEGTVSTITFTDSCLSRDDYEGVDLEHLLREAADFIEANPGRFVHDICLGYSDTGTYLTLYIGKD